MNDQRTEEWFIEKLSCVSASNLYKVMAKGQGKTRAGYMACLLDERLTGKPNPDTFDSEDMRFGVETEPEARIWYEFQSGEVEETGFHRHPTLANFGASPDGIRPAVKKGLEIKCPKRLTHLARLQLADAGKTILDSKYLYQCMAGIMCLQYDSWDFVSFHPHYPESMQGIIETVYPDVAMIADITREVNLFNAELDELEAKIKRRYGAAINTTIPKEEVNVRKSVW